MSVSAKGAYYLGGSFVSPLIFTSFLSHQMVSHVCVSFGHYDAIYFEKPHNGADVDAIEFKLEFGVNKYVIVKFPASNILEHSMVWVLC